MTKKKIILEDGRYLIYFSFEKNPKAEVTKQSKDNACDCGKRDGGSK